MTDVTVPKARLRIAIIGSGPSGFYTADFLLRRSDVVAEVDVFDRLPTPYGLVRAGVAPDHPNIKSVTKVFEKVAAREGFRFFGNVEVGRDVSVAELRERYDAVVAAYGTATERRLGVPGEDLSGSHAASELVAWYNGHPDFADHAFDLSAKRAVVIGNGNVAADVARMLALSPAELSATDAADHAIARLADSGIEEIVVMGRRGPAQAAFTNPEVRELGELAQADVVVDPADVRLDAASAAYLASTDCDPAHRRNVEMFTEFSERAPGGKPKRVRLRFASFPVEIRGDGHVESIVIGRSELRADLSGRVQAHDTGEREELACGLVFRSIGYLGVGLEGFPFDGSLGRIPNQDGRVIEPATGDQIPGLYAVGWIKRGPSGVIGTNRKDAADTVETLLRDWDAGRIPAPAIDAPPIEKLLIERGIEYVTYAGWQAIDAAEQAAGAPQGRPRVKLCRVDEMLCAARTVG
ncbi:NADP oxidoreductase [Mycobacteroides immunogenum]|uniref:ferredoxin--NADP(+) reductase n=1 Tax=Mycobacteroides immunogenum TaxID=83262 RepID=A0A179V6C7_9MYCO|nr:FAD-dependent oxidoreductase [Mycobacteroides immunogenum]OAT66593.1 NADP oxidoreductase [Mycobacteroides immunogenum]